MSAREGTIYIGVNAMSLTKGKQEGERCFGALACAWRQAGAIVGDLPSKEKPSMHDDDILMAVDAFMAARPYNPCCLLVDPDITRLQHAAHIVAARHDWPTLSIVGVLGDALLAIAPDRRSSQVKGILEDALRQHRGRPGAAVVVTDVDILFEPTLALDPLRLFRDLSREGALIVAWPGAYANNVLAYATPDHAHYRRWPQPDLCPTCIIAI